MLSYQDLAAQIQFCRHIGADIVQLVEVNQGCDDGAEQDWDPDEAVFDGGKCRGSLYGVRDVSTHVQEQADDKARQAHAAFDEEALEGRDETSDAPVLLVLGVIDDIRLHRKGDAEDAVDAEARDDETGQQAEDRGLAKVDQKVACHIEPHAEEHQAALLEVCLKRRQGQEHRQAGQDAEDADESQEIRAVQVVLEVVDDRRIADHVEGKVEQVQEKQDPCLSRQPFEAVLEAHVLIADRRGNDFFRTRECEEEDEHRNDAVERHRDEIALRFIACTKEVDERRGDGHDDGRANHRTDHAGRYQNIAFMDIRGQARDNRVQRDVHDCVRGAEQAVGDIGPDQLARRIEVGDIECQERKDCKGDGANQEVRASLSPARVGVIDNDAHHGVCHRIDELGHQHHRASSCCGNAEYIRVEYHQIRCHRTEHQITAKVAHAVSDANMPFTHQESLLTNLTHRWQPFRQRARPDNDA